MLEVRKVKTRKPTTETTIKPLYVHASLAHNLILDLWNESIAFPSLYSVFFVRRSCVLLIVWGGFVEIVFFIVAVVFIGTVVQIVHALRSEDTLWVCRNCGYEFHLSFMKLFFRLKLFRFSKSVKAVCRKCSMETACIPSCED